MYQITTESGVVGYTDAPAYCYKLPSGSPQVIGRAERARGVTATGVIFGGTIYNLPGHDDFEGETATVVDFNIGERLARLEAAQSDTDEQAVDQAYRLALLELSYPSLAGDDTQN